MAATPWSDKTHLKEVQYRDSTNLSARAALHQRFSVRAQGWYDWLFERLELPANARVLEVGCGYGALWQQVAARIPPGWLVTLTDLSAGMLEEARSGLEPLAHPFSFQVADAEDLPFEDGGFDAVLANHMLYHVPDRAKALAEVRRVLKDGGRFYAATNGEGHMAELFALAGEFDAELEPRFHGPTLAFTLESGREELGRFFDSVTLHRYEDALHVTEVEPLVQYVLSNDAVRQRLAGERLTEFRRHVEKVLTRNGVIEIRKDAGLFAAVR